MPEELLVESLHRLVAVGHALGSVLALVADVEVVVQSQNLKLNCFGNKNNFH